MAQLNDTLFCAVAATLFYTIVGLPIALRSIGSRHAWLLAPAVGWALTSAIALPLFEIVGMNRVAVLIAAMLGLAWALASVQRAGTLCTQRIPPLLAVAVITAALLAIAPTAGVLPKSTSHGVTLASPIFDHSKIALVDEMIRSGVPAANPFYGAVGTPDHVAYYYLWHFSAAVAAVATGVSGWAADAALTGFTAFASLLLMIGVAMWCGARPWASLLVVALSATASLRTTLGWMWPASATAVGEPSGFGGWLFQTSWAPQHVASATCVILASLQLSQLARYPGWRNAVVLGLIAAAAFQSSVWIGGIVLPLAGLATGLFLLVTLRPEQRLSFAWRAVQAGITAAVLLVPFVYDQFIATTLRGPGALIVFSPVAALGAGWSEGLRRILDPPAYWLVYLPLELPAIYPAGLLATVVLLTNFTRERAYLQEKQVLSILAAVGLVIAWLLASVVGDNNDLGWRAVLPAVMVLISFAATLLSRWPMPWARAAVLLAMLGLVLSLPETFKIIRENIEGASKPSEAIFAAVPDLWQAVRQHTSKTERIANNPLFLRDMTPWPVNISWALLANRRSCFAGSELAIPFAPISGSRRGEIEAQFVRIFGGRPEPDDLRQLAQNFRCDIVVITPQDVAWQHDPFASSALYRIVESRPDRWRIYRRIPQP